MASPVPPVAENLGTHHAFIRQKIPAWLAETALPRLTALTATSPADAAPPPELRNAFKTALGEHWSTQNTLDQKLAALNDLRAFAEPLLKTALLPYGDIDVTQTLIRLYAPADLPWWSLDVKLGVKSRTVSLLDAALHNFSASETFEDFAFLSKADARGQHRLLTFTHSATGEALSAETFKALCRSLDIGARYQKHLNTALGFDNVTVAESLRHKVVAQQKAALNSAAHMALAQQHIARDAYDLIQAMLSDAPLLQLDGRSVELHTLDLLGCRLTGVLVIAAPNPKGLTRLLVYMPNDPEQPLKEYASPTAFHQDCTQRLLGTPANAEAFPGAYARFISQFIAHDQRGRFFYTLKQRLFEWRRTPRPPVEGPTWQAQPVARPNLQWRLQAVREDVQNRSSSPARDDLWQYLYRVKLDKVVNDARELAISTAYADRMARWAWWDNLEKIVTDLTNAALLVLTPFVPLLGELMLAYTAYQLADDVFEGIVDWAQGQRIEAQEHLLAATQNIVQGLIFHRGGKIAEIAKLKLSPFVEGLKPVQLHTGESRLWNPDLSPYRLKAPPDTTGPQVVKVDEHHYHVGQDPITETHHLLHPQRPEAYRPAIRLNGDGACVLEGEQPRHWSDAQLMRRLGPQTQGLSDAQLEQVRLISGVDHDALRHLYANNQPTPPLLADTLKRFNSARQVDGDIQKVRGGQALDPSAYWFEQMVTELKGWPKSKALHVYPRADLSGMAHEFGNPNASGRNVLKLSTAEVLSGRLPEKVLAFLDPSQANKLLGETLPAEQQVQALRERLADYVKQQSESLIRHHYHPQEASADPQIQLLRSQYPDLPLSIARQLVRHTRGSDLTVMSEDKRLPLAVKNQVQEANFEVTSTRLFEQLHQDRSLSPEAERLILNTLRIHSDALGRLQIEVRDGDFFGDLRAQVGAHDAPDVRVLVRDDQGRYTTFDADGKRLHRATDFYSAMDHTLTRAKPATGSDNLRDWVLEHIAPPAERRHVLAEPPIRMRAARETLVLLRGGGSSSLRGTSPGSVEQRIRTLLPGMSEQGVKPFALASQSPEGLKVLEGLEAENKALTHALDDYVRAATQFRPGSRREAIARRTRALFADRLMEAWHEGYIRKHDEFSPVRGGASLDLSTAQRPDSLPTLPNPLRRVTHLNLQDCDFTSDRADFLLHFPNLRVLDLSDNLLHSLPTAIGNMRSLRELDLSGNQIALDADAVGRLRPLSRLRRLNLASNPLGATPDISLMPDLNLLELGFTGISEWPVGLFAQSRNGGFTLHLQGNPITSVPEVTPGSAEAAVVALTRLDRPRLRPDFQDLFDSYRESFGLDPQRTYEPQGDHQFWLESLGENARKLYRTVWDDLEHEKGSQGFFEVIKALEPPDFFEDPTDEARYQRNLGLLRSQVRTMLLAMASDTELREKLFMMSSFPGLCPDAGQQIFSNMGVEVLVSNANGFSRTSAEREERLVHLARGAARLKFVNHVARADIAHRLKPVEQGGLGLLLTSQRVDSEPGTVDEVEVHLAYQTRLARRLDLPWINEHMLYRRTSEVSDADIERAYNAVQALSEGDGLVDQMLLEPYWEQFLREQYPTEYAQHEQHIDEQFERLDHLQSEQQAYALEPDDSRRDTLKNLAEQLNLSQAQVLTGEPMPDALYSQVLNSLGDLRKQWLREQTHLLLNRAEVTPERPQTSESQTTVTTPE